METHPYNPYNDFDVVALGALGERIYSEKYKTEFEKKYRNKFVKIDLKSGKAYVGDTIREASAKASADAPNGFFYTLRVGHAYTDRI